MSEPLNPPRFHKEPVFQGLWNRLLQMMAMFGPGQTNLRVLLHRSRGVKIGHSVHIGTAVIIETARPHWVSIGNNVIIGMRSTLIAHFELNPPPETGSAEPVTLQIMDDVFIGPGCLILPNVTIGRGAVVTAGSVVTRSVPPLTMVQGNPARPIAKCEIPLTFGTPYREFLMRIKPIRSSDEGDRQSAGSPVESHVLAGKVK
jgi:serine acetyltransferase